MKIWLCQVQLHMDFQHHDTIYKRLMIEFQENAWTERWIEGLQEGRMVRTNFI